MVPVANSADVLSGRVRYFVKRERERDAALARLLDSVASPAYLFGGVVRDLALYGKRDLAGRDVDIDIVCATHGRSADQFLVSLEQEKGVARNKFGGLRMMTDRWKVDVWAAQDTWAFREGGFRYESVESLLETTITNWEAVLFRLDGGPLVCKRRYFEDIQAGHLDVVLGKNANPLGMYVRLVRACIFWPVVSLSSRARAVVREAMETHSFEGLKAYEREHYRHRYIEERPYEEVKSTVLASGAGKVRIRRDGEVSALIR